MADPDEALIEAIARSVFDVDYRERMAWENARGSTQGYYLVGARAAYAATVAHLGLVEVFTLRDEEGAIWVEEEGPREAAEQIQGSETLVRRLVSRWVEVDREAAVTAVDPDFCSRPGRVGVPWHSWRFDGDDDSHIICQFCGEMRDSLSGRVIRPAAEGMRADRIEGRPRCPPICHPTTPSARRHSARSTPMSSATSPRRTTSTTASQNAPPTTSHANAATEEGTSDDP